MSTLVDDTARDVSNHLNKINQELLKYASHLLKDLIKNKDNKNAEEMDIIDYIKKGGKVAQLVCDTQAQNEMMQALKTEGISFIQYNTTFGNRDVTGFLIKDSDIDVVRDIREQVLEDLGLEDLDEPER